MEFCRFMDEHPTVFHFVAGIREQLDAAGFQELTERDLASVARDGKYYIVRNGSNLIAFVVGSDFVPGPDGFNIIGSHVDANRISVKPSSDVPDELGYLRLGTAPYGDGLNRTWWDRDLGLGGRVIVKSRDGHAISSRLVRLPGVVGSIPTLAPHFGEKSTDSNKETNMVAVIGQVGTKRHEPPATVGEQRSPLYGKHPLPLLRAVARELKVHVADILEWELEMFSAEPARIGGLHNEFIYSSRMDDRLCSYTAIQGLIDAPESPHNVQVVALYDDEEIGSELRQGARGNLLDVVFATIFDSLQATNDERSQALANSFFVSADVTHAGNPNYSYAYLKDHTPELNVGMTVKTLGHFATTGVSAAVAAEVSRRAGIKCQTFAPRNDVRSGGTIGLMLSAHTGISCVDVGIPIMSMHSIRETTGIDDVKLGTKWFREFLAEPVDIDVD